MYLYKKNLADFLVNHTPCYIYNGDLIKEQCRKLKNALLGFEFLYSIKTNPFPDIIQSVSEEGFGADAASAREVSLALENGMQKERVFYSTPGKTDQDIEKCYAKCVMIADSIGEIRRMDKEAARRGEILKIGIRINPDFSMEGGAGSSSKFGIDAERIEELEEILSSCQNIQVNGIHIHIKSQILDCRVLGKYYHNCFALAKRIHYLEKVTIEYINFGSGIGALYDATRESPVDLQELGELVQDIVAENQAAFKARLYIETGRFIVCNAGTYCTKIVDIKESRGQKYLIVENGMNGFLRSSIANLLLKNTDGLPSPGQEPLYTGPNAFHVEVLNNADEYEIVSIVGNLCTALDVFCENKKLRRAYVGDIVAVTNAGSYGYSLSPLLFSSHNAPGQYYFMENDIMASLAEK